MPTLIAGRYEVLEALDRHAAGAVYKVRHALLDSVLVVTVLAEELTADGDRLARIQRAARAALGLRHDHIVPVLDFGRDDGRYYLVEAFTDASPLDVSAHGPLPPADALHVVRQLADALAHAHDRGVVHGAIAPAWVSVAPGTVPRALLSGFVLGSAPRAPELSTAIDARTDIQALGLLLYEMLEGRPFVAGTADESGNGSTQVLPTYSRIVPSGVSALVARAIRHAPAQRQQSMTQLRHEIDTCLGRIVEKSLGESRPVAAVTPAATRAHRPRRVAERPTTEATTSERKVVRVAFPIDDEETVESIPTPSPATRRILGPNGVRVGQRRLPARRSVLAALALVLVGGWLVLRPAGGIPTASTVTAALADAPEPSVEAAVADPVVAPPLVLAVATSEPPTDAAVEASPPALPEDGDFVGPPAPVRLPPQIISSRPSGERVDAFEGAAVDFTVRASNGLPGDRMAYTWFLDGRKVGRREAWRFSAPYGAAGTAHTVEVQVADATGAKGPRVAWTVDVVPRMSEANVLDWLGRLTAALERKDVATLRLYGLVTDDADGEAFRNRVSRQKAARVVVENETVVTEGRYARVRFDLAEFDEEGTRIATRDESFELEKDATGFIALRTR